MMLAHDEVAGHFLTLLELFGVFSAICRDAARLLGIFTCVWSVKGRAIGCALTLQNTLSMYVKEE